MKLTKLLEKIAKEEFVSGDEIRIIDFDTKITYYYDFSNRRHSFFKDGKKIDIMEYFGCEFEPTKKKVKEESDIWDAFDKSLRSKDEIQRVEGNGISVILDETRRFTPEMAYAFLGGNANVEKTENGYEFMLKNNSNGKFLLDNEGNLSFIPFSKEEITEYSYEDTTTIRYFLLANTYFDAAASLISDYKGSGFSINNFDNINKSDITFGNQRDALIKTLLAFSCELYIKSMLLSQGKSQNELKQLSHILSVLFNELDIETMSNVFEDMERNGYDIVKYQSPHLKYDANPDLIEKFMVELARDESAFMEARYYDSGDINIDYNFLYRFASSLRNIAMENEKINPHINKGNNR